MPTLLTPSENQLALRAVALRAAVRRLNAVTPDWRTRVDPATLDMYDGYGCVLGQVYGDYVDGLKLVTNSGDLGEDLLVDAAFTANFPVELWLAELRNPTATEEATP